MFPVPLSKSPESRTRRCRPPAARAASTAWRERTFESSSSHGSDNTWALVKERGLCHQDEENVSLLGNLSCHDEELGLSCHEKEGITYDDRWSARNPCDSNYTRFKLLDNSPGTVTSSPPRVGSKSFCKAVQSNPSGPRSSGSTFGPRLPGSKDSKAHSARCRKDDSFVSMAL